LLEVSADDLSWISASATALARRSPANHFEDLSRCGGTSPNAGAARRSFLSVAFSWLLNWAIEGFAAYAEATCPALREPGAARREFKEPIPQPRLVIPNEATSEPTPPRASRSRLPQRDVGSGRALFARSGWTAATAVRMWSRWRRARDRWCTIEALQALDDWTLRDIGLHRSQIAGVARYEIPWTW
jgi:uncharacterized protein YjiS (DUF1127 family)